MTKYVTLEDGRKCTLFHPVTSPFSNFYKCRLQICDPDSTTSKCFTSSKQYFMYRKAMLFEDVDLAEAVLNEHDPKKVKELSAKMRKYNGARWNALNDEEMRRGLIAKFSQNDRLRRLLFFTGDSLIAECSGKERIWGNGLRFDNERTKDQKEWKGANKQGRLLMDVRTILRQDPAFADEVEEIDAKLRESEDYANDYFAYFELTDSSADSDALSHR